MSVNIHNFQCSLNKERQSDDVSESLLLFAVETLHRSTRVGTIFFLPLQRNTDFPQSGSKVVITFKKGEREGGKRFSKVYAVDFVNQNPTPVKCWCRVGGRAGCLGV